MSLFYRGRSSEIFSSKYKEFVDFQTFSTYNYIFMKKAVFWQVWWELEVEKDWPNKK
mgnify:CR=1 FL=1